MATTSTRRSAWSRTPARPAAALSVGLLGNAAEIFPRARAPRRRARCRDRPDLGARPAERLPAGRAGRSSGGRSCSRRDPAAVERAAKESMAAQVARDARLPAPGRADARLRQQHPPAAPRRWASRTRSTSRASCRPTSARCSAAAKARSAGSRSRAIRRTSTRPTPRSRSCSPTTAHLHPWLDLARERDPVPGPAGADLLARPRRARQGRPRLQRDGGERRAHGARS